MFNRVTIKQNAKAVLKRSYWMAFGVTILVGIVSGAITLITRFTDNGAGAANSLNQETFEQLASADSADFSSALALLQNNSDLGKFTVNMGIGMLIAFVLSLAWSFFVSGPATIGLSRFFVATREQQNPVEFNYVLYGFKNNYLKMAWAYFSTQLILALWGMISVVPYILAYGLTYLTKQDAWLSLSVLALPCMIPAFIKTYQYRMVPYVLANNSAIDGKRARELSTSMTDGNKWNLFVLDLSFIGWILLGSLACGVGVLFVLPYINASQAEAYTCLKTEAMQTKGVSGSEELPSLAGATV